MLRCCRLFLAGVAVLSTTAAHAQTSPVLVSQAVARSHVASGQPAVYPRIAQAANVEGAVHFDVEISTDGTVARAKILAGHPMLNYAAEQAIKEWRFTPFTSGGVPVPVRTSMTFFFTRFTPSEVQIAAALAYSDAVLLCMGRLELGELAEAERACVAAEAAAGSSRSAREFAADLLRDVRAALEPR